jgi:hypothetical protein
MKYYVYGYLTMSVFAEVEATDEADAAEKAMALDPPSLCHQCAGEQEPGCWGGNGFDDVPDDCVQDVELAGEGE